MSKEMRQLALDHLGKTCLVMYEDNEKRLAGAHGRIGRVDKSLCYPPYPKPEVLERLGIPEGETLIPMRLVQYDCLWLTYGGGPLGIVEISIEDIISIEERKEE